MIRGTESIHPLEGCGHGWSSTFLSHLPTTPCTTLLDVPREHTMLLRAQAAGWNSGDIEY